MKISEGGREGGRGGFSDQTKVADARFVVLVIELTPFLSTSVCWFWFQLSQTKSEKMAELSYR